MLVCAFCTFLHTRPRVQRAPGIPCALLTLGRMILENLGRIAPRDRGAVFNGSHVSASEATQSILRAKGRMDCFVAVAPRNDELLIRNNSQQIAVAQTASASEWRLRLRSALDVNGRAAKPPPMSEPAHTIKSRVAAISVFASAGMATAKFVVGIAIGSLALISEALHSSVDVVATVITWMVVRVSDRPADKEHHYGHGKLESISALG